MVTLGSLLVVCPPIVRKDLGPWSPWGRYMKQRRRFDAVIAALIAEARSDPAIEERKDVLALLLQARYEDGEPISDEHIADELLTLLGSGHETTASSLAWALERLSRYPELCKRLADEADAGGSELRQATTGKCSAPGRCSMERRGAPRRESSWASGCFRRAPTSSSASSWRTPPKRISPTQRRSTRTATWAPPAKPVAWIPFGGGVNRCVGAAFANLESDVVLRMLLREFRFAPTDAPGEKAFWRGVATVPAKGARATVYRRADKPPVESDSLSVAEHGRA